MKKLFACLLVSAFLATGCNSSTPQSTTPSSSGIGKGKKDMKENKSVSEEEVEITTPEGKKKEEHKVEKKAEEKKP
jgi:uncharacterized protein YcfL